MTSKRSFTLLEMMVTLVLLSIIGTLVTVQGVKLIKTHRFEKEIGMLLTALQEAQILAVTHQTDLSFDIFSEKGALYYRITTDEPLSEAILSQKTIAFNTVQKILFNGKKQKNWCIEIDSRGSFAPKGTFSFFTKEETGALYIDFQYGSLIRCFNSPPPSIKQTIPEPPKT